MMDTPLSVLFYAFATLFIILDPLLSIPIFVGLTEGCRPEEKAQQAWLAVRVAGVILTVFLLFGLTIFDLLGISPASFKVAGGILLLILGMQVALGVEFPHDLKAKQNIAGVLIGTPLLCGPGAITTITLLSTKCGIPITAAALVLCLAVTWLILRYAADILRILGETVTDIMGRVLGMFLAAIAVKLIAEGVTGLAI
ncbi:MarC family protein [Methanofollis sp. W23]|uniref:MarC family protein n=1 Tax=Methanofollis sp. W23 TaxID=2817849 RepID=UPI001FDA7CD8|nr:MarC family protein [Methanofollis sp. W23]